MARDTGKALGLCYVKGGDRTFLKPKRTPHRCDMAKIVLTRHGHVEGIRPERFRGRADLPLTELGLAQAEATAARIASSWRPAAVYASPMARCVMTGEAIALACGLTVQVMPELNDIDYGAWQGETHDEIQGSSPELYKAWRTTPHLVRFPEGESLQDLALRTADALRFALGLPAEAIVVFVGHESVNRVLLMQALDQPLSLYWRITQHPCAINELEVLASGVRVLLMNDAHHLSNLCGSAG